MSLSSKNTSNIPKNERDGIYVSKHKYTKKNVKIDLIDLENEYLKLDKSCLNPFPIDVFPKAIQEIAFEARNKYQFSLDYLGAGILSAASSGIGVSHKVEGFYYKFSG